MTPRILYRAIPILTASLVYFIFRLLPYESNIVETYYSQGFYKYWRIIWDATLSQSPVPLIYLLLIVVAYYLIRSYRACQRRTKSLIDFVVQYSLDLIVLIALFVLSFYLLWGYNYKRINVINQLLSQSDEKISERDLFAELDEVTIRLNHLRATLPDSIAWSNLVSDDDDVYRPALKQIYTRLNLDDSGDVRVRSLYPRGSLLHWSTAGVYIPFVSEGHIDPGLHPIVWPFTILHEMSHGYGYTGEDTCNFWALLACVNSDSSIIQYSGYMSYWRYLRSNAYRTNRDQFYDSMSCVNPLVLKDLDAIYEYSNRYPDILPLIRDLIYDSYLKRHGISDGLKNYSRIIVLSMQWQKQYGSLSIKSSAEGQ